MADGATVVVSASLLTGLLVAVVPIIALSTGISLLVLVGLAGVVYATALVITDSIFEGMCGAVFVLCTFLANIPVLRAPFGGSFIPSLNIMFVDVVAVPLALLFVTWGVWNVPSIELRTETVAGYALFGLAVWSVLAAIVNHGPSQPAALFFAVDQFRYLLLFALGATIVRYTGVRNAVYSILIAVFGNVAFAFAETLNRGSFGLSYLGEASKPTLGTFSIGPVVLEASMYAGGFSGFSRILVALLLLTLPIVFVVLMRGSYWKRSLAVLCLLGGVFLTRISNSDSGFAAFLLTIALVVVSLLYVHVTSSGGSTGSETIDYTVGYLGGIGAGVLAYLLFSLRVIRNTDLNRGNDPGTGGTATSSETMATEVLIPLLNKIPKIDVSNVSIRVQEYMAAIVVGFKYPLFGLGGSNFKMVSESYGLPAAFSVHNTLLGYLAATGFPGVVFLLVTIIAVLVVAIKNAMTGDPGERLFWSMIVCGMLGFHAMTFWIVGHRIQTTYMTFWVFAGAVVGSRYWSAS